MGNVPSFFSSCCCPEENQPQLQVKQQQQRLPKLNNGRLLPATPQKRQSIPRAVEITFQPTRKNNPQELERQKSLQRIQDSNVIEINRLQQILKMLEIENNKTFQQQKIFQNQLANNTNQRNNLDAQLRSLYQRLTPAERQLSAKINQLNTLKQQLKATQLYLRNQTRRESEVIVDPRNKDPNILKRQLSKRISDLQYQITQRQDQNAKTQLQRDQIQSSFAVNGRDNQSKARLNQIYQQISTVQTKRAALQEQQRKLQDSLQQTVKALQEIKSRIGRQQNQIRQLNKGILLTQEQIRKLKISQVNKDSDMREVGHFFAGDVLDGQDEYKYFLIQTLQKKMRQKIIGTRLIYKFDPLNKTNFHKYFDKINNLVVAIKLANGYMMAVWNQGCFLPNTISDRDALIISLTNRKVFELLQPNKRAISYDNFYMIYGNSEVRLKSQDSKIYSNLGINNGYFDVRGHKADVLFGSGKEKEVQMEVYEIFQLKLK